VRRCRKVSRKKAPTTPRKQATVMKSKIVAISSLGGDRKDAKNRKTAHGGDLSPVHSGNALRWQQAQRGAVWCHDKQRIRFRRSR
jgi:hypothetical protein